MTAQLPLNGLYAITPSTLKPEVLLERVELALSSGIALLQYRDKNSPAAKKIAIAKALQKLCRQYHTTFIINDEPQLALDCQADGVHLGQGDGSLKLARQLLGEDAIIGITCHHDLSLAITAQQQGADYVAFGRFFNSHTKPGKPLADTVLLLEAKQRLNIPIVCIGGINADNGKALIRAGADYLAVVEALFSATDIMQTCGDFSAQFKFNSE